MNIVYVLNSIATLGGIQTVTPVKANALAQYPENNVTIITSESEDISNIQLDSRVKLISLDVNFYKDDWKSMFHRLNGIIVKSIIYKKRLFKCLEKIKPDVVVSVGLSEKYILQDIKKKLQFKLVREFHSSINYRTAYAQGKLNTLIAKLSDIYEFKFRIKKNDLIVLLTHQDYEENWSAYHNQLSLTVIPNPCTFKSESYSSTQNKKVVTVGRLDIVKGYDKLINAWKIVSSKHPDWSLEIWGDGSEKQALQNQIETLNLSSVKLCGRTSDVANKLIDSSLFVLSSKIEGFALVLVEAMTCGLPCVSFQCPCGPKDIIKDGVDGLLVSQDNVDELASSIIKLIEDDELRKRMGVSARENVKRFSLDTVTKSWMNLFNDLCNS